MPIGATIGAGALVAGGTAFAGSQQASAARDAADSNIDRELARQQFNLRLFRESRGSEGSAILPTFFGDTEQDLATELSDLTRERHRAVGTPRAQLERFQQIQEQQRPNFEFTNQAVSDVLSGGLERRQLDQAEPVFEARRQLGGAQRRGILESTQDRLNKIKAADAQAGFIGGGSTQQNALLRQSSQLQGQAAAAEAQAELQNALQRQGIQQQNEDLRLRSLSLPLQQARQATEFENLPSEGLARNFRTNLSPFEFFRLNPQAFQSPQPPQVGPVPTQGQVIGSTIAGLGQGAGNIIAQQQLLNTLQQQNTAANAFGGAGFNSSRSLFNQIPAGGT